MPRRTEDEKRPVTDAEFNATIEKMIARGKREIAEEQDEELPKGKVFSIGMKRLSVKLEQNLGCELPVCVASRRETKRQFIEVVTDEGVVWRLTRRAGGHLPAPDHYPYWLWFLDRCQAAAEYGLIEPPRILVNPVEIFDLFGAPRRGKRSGYDGWRYDALDSAYDRFSSLTICQRAAFYDGKRSYRGTSNLGTLCYYSSWRAQSHERQRSLDFAKAFVQPGPLLWESIKAGYLKSVPLEPIRHLSYVEQRLLTYLAKHCKPGGTFSVSPHKLLPKIPLLCGTNVVKTKLGPHHEALAKIGFLHDARVEGRGRSKILVYERSAKVFPPPAIRTVDESPLLT